MSGPPELVSIVVEARDLDSDERRTAVVRVPVPVDAGARRHELERAVAGLHPDARLRSFADAAATFLDSTHLVVAHFPDLPKRRLAAARGTGAQPALFAT